MNTINNILSQVAGLPAKEATSAKLGAKATVNESITAPVGANPSTGIEQARAQIDTHCIKVLAEGNGLIIHDYSEKAFAVTGKTKENKDSLMKLGGKYQPFLKVGKGFIFSKKNLEKVIDYIAG